jgi:flagellar biosynthesis/type III secretory pathway M-ring protein FliF/YscJ
MMLLQEPVPPIPPIGPQFDPNLLFNDGVSPVFVLIPVAAFIAITIILWPIMRAFARRLERKGNVDSALRAEVEQLHTRLAEMDSLHSRLLELEERVDFTERLLAQAQQPARLGAPTEEGGR